MNAKLYDTVEGPAETFLIPPGMALVMRPQHSGVTSQAVRLQGASFSPVTVTGVPASVGPFTQSTLVSVASQAGSTYVSVGSNLADGSVLAGDGGVRALSAARELATNVTATGTSRTGSGYFAGIFVSAYSGGPQTITARDSTDASGPIIGIWSVSATGYYWLDAGGVNSVRILSGVHLTISGGTSRTVCAVVEP